MHLSTYVVLQVRDDLESHTHQIAPAKENTCLTSIPYYAGDTLSLYEARHL